MGAKIFLLPPGPVSTGLYRVPPLELPKDHALFERASWWNRAGWVDRSGCFEISSTEAMKLGRVGTTPAVNGEGRIQTCVFELGVEALWELHRTRQPRTLRGDYRRRANVMMPDAIRTGRASGRPAHHPSRRRREPDAMRRADGPDYLCHANPNKGATCRKVLGLAEDWWQAMRVEIWEQVSMRPGDPRLRGRLIEKGLVGRRPFLICPGRCYGPSVRYGDRWDRPLDGAGATPPPLSTRPRSCLCYDRAMREWRCQERVRKLFLPLCTPREWRDAQIAWAWLSEVRLQRMRGRIAGPDSPLERLVIHRYGELFPPRALRCSACLRMRYARLSDAHLVPEVAWRFPRHRAPELPDPCARNIQGGQFAHNQLKLCLTKSELKNARTRSAALAKRQITNPDDLTRREWARLRKWQREEEERLKKERDQRLDDWQDTLESLSEPGGSRNKAQKTRKGRRVGPSEPEA